MSGLILPFTPEEVKVAMVQIGGLIARNDSCILPGKLENCWQINDRSGSCFLHSRIMLKELNDTMITLIPKIA